MKLNINYNSYTYKFEIKTDAKSFNNEESGKQCKQIIKENEKKRIEVWFENFLRKFGEDFNHPDLDIVFTSIQYECNKIEEIVTKLKLEKNWKIVLETVNVEDKNVLGELHTLVNSLIEDKEDVLREQLEEKQVFSKIDDIEKREVSVVVIAPMSAGKSTLINALIGCDLLPSKNKATTATICKIKDIDGKEGFDAVVKNGKGEKLGSRKNIDKTYIEEYNNKGNNEDIEILIEGDLKNIDSTDLKLVLVDTPGPNNSRNLRHQEVTLDYIKDKNSNPLILYVLNAQQLETNDDRSFLVEISEFIKQNGSKAKERIIFVLNRIDEFKKSDGDFNTIIEECKEYLNDLNITNPKIFPLSAQLAKLALIDKLGVIDNEDDKDQLEFLIKKMIRKNVIQFSPISQKQKELLYEEVKNDKFKASLHYSGLTALQIYINEYVNNTHKIEVANELINAIRPALDNAIIEHEKAYFSSEDDIKRYKEDLEKIAPFLSEKFKEDKKILVDKINTLSDDNFLLDELNKKVKRKFDQILLKFNDSDVKIAQAKILLADAEKIISELENELSSSIKSENNKRFKDIKNEIQKKIEDSFTQLVLDAKLSKQNENMLKNYIQIKINSKIDEQSKFKKEIEKEVSDSSWYNPFSWGRTKKIFVIGTDEYVDLNKIYNSQFSPERIRTLNEIKMVIDSFKENVKNLKVEGLEKIDEIERNLTDKINQEKKIKEKIDYSESIKAEKKNELYKMKSYQKSIEIIIS